ncbi:MAG: acetamidase/formamidase family protein, partial [Caldilineaceae bacterium]|nr:acetamidase/formamidase family protein [Caldilineaceae bacterium]
MTVHHFQPTHYHHVLATVAPVLTVRPGDTVQTTTVDAAGADLHGDQVTSRGNPMTGPFYVQGAEPGDTLVVHLDQIVPNRDVGWSNTMLAPNVVDPDFVRELPWPPAGERHTGRWRVDVAAGKATLLVPQPSFGAVEVPLAPMLGCFGVAPAGDEAISTATSGPHGGNMDYRGFVAGVTVYFPVSTPGALFFLGDGHAVQG